MKLCVAEKPSVAGEIANILGANVRRGGYFEGNDWCVTWVFGHLCELKEPADYRPEWKSWRFDYMPIIPQRFGIKLKNDDGVKRQFDVIKNLISQAELVVNCGDAGQEGELIQRWVYQLAEIKCPMKRLWISSLTEESIRDGFNNLRAGSDFDLLYQAGAARAMADWMLGMNATRAYTIRFATNRQVLSIGRVQTPTLALIVNRHFEIANFKPETYWELKTIYRGVTFNSTEGKYNVKEKAETVLQTIVGKPFEITDVQTKEGNEAPPRLFDLTSLQVECNKKYAFSAEETLQLIQALYEKKLTTYPRVDTTFLSDDIYPKVPKILEGLTPYMNLVQPLLGQKIKKSKKVFDNSKVTDHHAIIPTGVTPSSTLPRNEKLVYDLVARRFIANFYADSKVSTTTVLGKVDQVEFKCSGKQILSPGWRVVYGNTADEENKGDEQIMPEFVIGESGEHEPSLQEKQTTPPKPYTEATLLRAMETAGKQVDDEEIRDLMKDNGIGRPSTRAAIIETLFKRKYIEKQKKNLLPTDIGIRLIQTIHIDLLKSVEMTGMWEKKLRLIEKGEYQTQDFLSEMKSLVAQLVDIVHGDNSRTSIGMSEEQQVTTEKKASKKEKEEKEKKPRKPKESAKPVDISEVKCPMCQKQMLEGKSAWGCSGYKEGCQFRVPFEFMHKKLTLTQLAVLCKKKQTGVINGFVDEVGVKRSGKIVLSDLGQLGLEMSE